LSTDTICISKGEYEITSNWPYAKKNIHLIYNGITAPTFLPQVVAQNELARIMREPESIFKNTLVMGSIAELTKNKSLITGLRSLKENPNYIYIIIGDGEELATLKNAVIELKLEHRVFFAGFVKNASRYIKAFDVFLLPSIKEGLPYVLIEAGFASVPAIASNVGGIPELVVDRHTGFLIEPQQPHQIAAALTQLQTKQMRVQMGEEYFARVSIRCDMEEMVKQTTRVYKKGLSL
jgi:glycosyltransferase involved in cell wall biosynthesis